MSDKIRGKNPEEFNALWKDAKRSDQRIFDIYREEFRASRSQSEKDYIYTGENLISSLRPFGANGKVKRRYRGSKDLSIVYSSNGDKQLRYTDYDTGQRIDEPIVEQSKMALLSAARNIDRTIRKERFMDLVPGWVK